MNINLRVSWSCQHVLYICKLNSSIPLPMRIGVLPWHILSHPTIDVLSVVVQVLFDSQ
jgi:hypothetical protein